jgi:hypothetical protein
MIDAKRVHNFALAFLKSNLEPDVLDTLNESMGVTLSCEKWEEFIDGLLNESTVDDKIEKIFFDKPLKTGFWGVMYPGVPPKFSSGTVIEAAVNCFGTCSRVMLAAYLGEKPTNTISHVQLARLLSEDKFKPISDWLKEDSAEELHKAVQESMDTKIEETLIGKKITKGYWCFKIGGGLRYGKGTAYEALKEAYGTIYPEAPCAYLGKTSPKYLSNKAKENLLADDKFKPAKEWMKPQ